MKLLSLFTPFRLLWALCPQRSGEPTTAQKLSALLLALREVETIVSDIKEEKDRFDRTISSGLPINRSEFPFYCSPARRINRLEHWLNRSIDLMSSVSNIPEEHAGIALRCLKIIEPLSSDSNIRKLKRSIRAMKLHVPEPSGSN